MRYRVCKSIEVENGHMLSKHPDKCRFPHGHTRKVEIVLEAATLDDNEMVCDFKAVKEIIGEYLETFDHAMCMNTEDPSYAEMKERHGDRVIGFDHEDPTTEVLARVIFEEFAGRLDQWKSNATAVYPIRAEVRLATIRVWETSSSWAEYGE